MDLGQYKDAQKSMKRLWRYLASSKIVGRSQRLGGRWSRFGRQADYQKAISYLEQALAIFHELGNAGAEAWY